MAQEKGGCACGEIQFHYSAENVNVINCHCQTCRTHNGGAFSSYAIVPAEGFVIKDPHQHLRSYQKDESQKYFCGNCGTPLYNTHADYPAIRLVYLGSLENAAEMKPKINVWCENQLDWVSAINDIQSLAQGVQ